MAKGRIDIDISMCKGCELCIAACRNGVIKLSEQGKVNKHGYRYVVAVDTDKCTACGFCGQMCPDSAITVWRFKEESKDGKKKN